MEAQAQDSFVPIALMRAWRTIARTIPRMGSDRPSIGLPDLTYTRCGPSEWVDGFWSGQLWLAYEETGEPLFFASARAQRPYFADRLSRPESHNHDLGFLYTLSAVADYKVTGDGEARWMAVAAADALLNRYHVAGRFIPAWNGTPRETPKQQYRKRGKIIIDSMENLALLYWATEATGQPQYAEVASAHAITTRDYLVRPDGSTYHTYDFDPETGAPIGGFTHQGYADGSCWSRGQAWAIHGFTYAYAYTGDPRFQETARRLADYAIAHLPADGVPYWDYRLPNSVPHYRDSAAAAITAAGLFALAESVHDASAATSYRLTARAMLATLMAQYTTEGSPQAEGLLLHGASNVNADRTDAMLPYGDYFFIEALLRANGRTRFYW
ncbi:MAG: glycoside hydrolase family 88 protein [Thermomicrobia bacterium]|nr:glycoside hydrolase family 88 protein [Thermomicrobia bacterium]MCA1723200.1 glycoside hydrolase family 88 protein [Thermomicrobia bacterium]